MRANTRWPWMLSGRRCLAAALLLGAFGTASIGAQAPAATRSVATAVHTFRIAKGSFELDGKPIQLISGEMHYARIPRAYWRQRLRMARAMGLNAIATYVFWNYHEVRPGVFDFHSGNRDLAEFIRIAQEEGLWVILRPGPYVCAEWDFGGYPSYLLKSPAATVRSNDARYMTAARRYINALAKQVRPLLVTHGGPILMVQVENEYGSFGSDSTYKAASRRMLIDAGIDVPLFTADGDWLLDKGGIPGVFATANGETDYDALTRRIDAFNKGTGPYMVAEFYPGWLSHWGEPFPRVSTKSFLSDYDNLLAHGASINLYMFTGGTNFGFTSGANYTRRVPIQPDMTSYDYDAPLSEAGWPTPKYYALRDVIRRHVSYPIPDIPDSLPVIALPSVALRADANLYDLIASVKPTRSAEPLSFEDIDQSAGFVLYRHEFAAAAEGLLEVPGLRDYGEVFVNGRRVATLERSKNGFAVQVRIPAGGRLDILVENLGRINYGAELVRERKGIIAPVVLNGVRLTDWEMYGLPFSAAPPAHVHKSSDVAIAGVPTVYRGTFTLTGTGDTFLDMRAWNKGFVFVNGVNLGRYWNVGPQQTLYLPGAWLHRGRNEIVVVDLDGASASGFIAGLRTPILDQLRPESVVKQ